MRIDRSTIRLASLRHFYEETRRRETLHLWIGQRPNSAEQIAPSQRPGPISAAGVDFSMTNETAQVRDEVSLSGAALAAARTRAAGSRSSPGARAAQRPRFAPSPTLAASTTSRSSLS